MREILNAGAIKRSSLSEDWMEKLNEPDPFFEGWQKSYALTLDPSVEIVLFYRGTPIDKSYAEYFQNLLRIKAAQTVEEKLSPLELVQLQVLMGFESTGNNQYTNPNRAESGYAPAFDLKEAFTRRIKNKTVLYVSGTFSHGKCYAGLFYSADPAGIIIEESMMQAPSTIKYNENFHHFQNLMDHIEWKI